MQPYGMAEISLFSLKSQCGYESVTAFMGGNAERAGGA